MSDAASASAPAVVTPPVAGEPEASATLKERASVERAVISVVSAPMDTILPPAVRRCDLGLVASRSSD